MIAPNALHGRIVEKVARAPAALVERLGRHDAATIVDAMGGVGAMHHTIKPLVGETRIAGSALTVLTAPGDVLYVKKALDLVRPGDAVVIAAEGALDRAVFGDHFARFFAHRGAVAAVIDGATRDSQGVVELGFPLFCRACCVAYQSSVGPGAINVPIVCGGVAVAPGDIVVGNRDGVVVVPQAEAARVADLADAFVAAAADRPARLLAGESASDYYGLEPLLARWSGKA
jgi:4-hydroxy-4-methyl-2-oxoglutarate aldolase